ncbi:MAG TPA: hypothetical protein EYG82_05675 [Sulfurovum sp.]|nr:hypothetical protein [Sulfurovum sp.]
MRYLLLSFILLFSFSACTDDSAQKEMLIKKLKETAEAEKNLLRSEIRAKETALKKAQLASEKLQLETSQLKKELFTEKKLHIALQNKKVLAETMPPKDEKLSKIGISIQENKITLDTDKTKDFFENFARNISSTLEKASKELQQGTLTEDDAGIHIDENTINIDLNKTKDFLQEWGEKMQGFIKEFDTIAQDLNMESEKINTTK